MNQLMVGFARVNITPMMGINVAGYYQERLADGVLDDLELNVLALACEDKKAVVVSGDLIAFETAVAEDFLVKIAQETRLPEEAIVLHGTHTHTGPELKKDSGDELEEEYFQLVRRKIVDAVNFALADLKPAKMGWAIGNAPNIAFIRRYIMKDGSVRTNPGVNNPDILKPIGEVDEQVNVVRFDREGADSIVLVNFGNHPDTVGGCKISGDWPGFLRRTLEKTLDNVKCIFVNGAEGDVNHVNVWPTGGYLNDTFNDFDDVSRGYGHARFMGRVMTGGVLQVFDKVKYVDVESLTFMRRTIQIPSNMPEPEEMEEARYIHEMHLAGRDEDLPYKGMMLTTQVAAAQRKLNLEHGPEYFEMKLAGLAVGEVALVGIPGEPFNGVGVGLKESGEFPLIMPACLVNGAQGYFPMRDSYDEGGYEAGSSIFKAGVAELIIEEGRELLKDMKLKCDEKEETMKHVVLERYPIGNKRFIWKQKDYTLSTFAGVPMGQNGEGDPKEYCDKYVKHLKEAGFNLMELGWVNHENAWLAVDACEKYELDLLFQDMSIMGGMNKYHLDNKVPYEVAEDMVNRLKDKKYTIGFYVWDEPCTDEQLKEARRQMDMLQKAAPEKLLFTVAIPSYNNEDNGRGFLWENGQYAPYTEKFVREMDPPVLSFDYYPVGNYFNAWLDHKFTRENQLDDTYMWLDMAQHRMLARENNLPFWFYYQSYSLYPCTDYFIFPMIRCFMYGAILYGAKGLQGYAVGEKNNLFCKANGDKDIFFEDQKKIHGEIAALGNTLMALDSKMIYHSAELLPDCEYLEPLVDKIEDSNIFKGELPHRTSVGELEDAYGNRYVVILNRDYEKSLSASLAMKGEFRVYEVSREDGKQYVLHEKTTEIPINLEPGDAVVLRIQKASEEAFTIEYKLVE